MRIFYGFELKIGEGNFIIWYDIWVERETLLLV